MIVNMKQTDNVVNFEPMSMLSKVAIGVAGLASAYLLNYGAFAYMAKNAQEELRAIPALEQRYLDNHKTSGSETMVRVGNFVMPTSIYFLSITLEREDEVRYYSKRARNPFARHTSIFTRELLSERIKNLGKREINIPK